MQGTNITRQRTDVTYYQSGENIAEIELVFHRKDELTDTDNSLFCLKSC